ncbi:MAG: hypothetical protein HY681_06210 [Chloroflexi bacterium]|nr:hypothetical protein [Chloroflexota bacterium]
MKKYLAITLGLLALTLAMVAAVQAADVTRMEAGLTGSGAQGKGTWRLLDTGTPRMSVEVSDLQIAGLAAGDQMTVSACGSISTITLVEVLPGIIGGDLNLDSRLGDIVPTCQAGDPVTVTGGGVTLSGAFVQDE